MNQAIRWHQRFENFQKARKKLLRAVNAHKENPDEELYHMALIQAFEFTFELGWKTLKDYLAYSGLNQISLPREVIKQSFHHGLITDGQCWIDMMESRNLMAHTYDEQKAAEAIEAITHRYLDAITQVYEYLKERF